MLEKRASATRRLASRVVFVQRAFMILTCDVQELIDIRRRHQTRQAETGFLNVSMKSSYLKRIEVLARGSSVTTRWRKAAPGAREGVIDGMLAPAPTAGSSANASKVATGIVGKCQSTIEEASKHFPREWGTLGN
ncbi:hypothetical protein R3P38DRAFT_3218194 [Favolaschia claudopus]|uniref:Uncharacterized protein n=1 Tax=Favolaschia claudopus TaxID=2862362 RepID=A0AAW0A465_9AGAR